MRIGSLCDIDQFFTDSPLPAPLAERCRGWATRVCVVDP